MKIYIKYFSKKYKLNIIKKGDWIDLITLNDVEFTPYSPFQLIDLNIALKLPKGFEAIVVPRSSTFMKYNVLQTNGIGVIDNSYCGETDIWKFPALFVNLYNKESYTIPAGSRLCQFRIQLNQFASFWTKLKWFFTFKLEFIEVERLEGKSRGGFGTTG